MLKKLFISLLLLSILTSEGIVNIPQYIFDHRLGVWDEQGLWADEELVLPVSQALQAQSTNKLLYSDGCSQLLLETRLDLEGGKHTGLQDADSSSPTESYLPCVSEKAVVREQALSGRDMIIRSSDVSPPSSRISRYDSL